jgi:hypothetical protein
MGCSGLLKSLVNGGLPNERTAHGDPAPDLPATIGTLRGGGGGGKPPLIAPLPPLRRYRHGHTNPLAKNSEQDHWPQNSEHDHWHPEKKLQNFTMLVAPSDRHERL